jgi:hypothetical protein
MSLREAQAAHRVTAQVESLWDFDYEPTLADLSILYDTAKRQQWDANTAIDWSQPLRPEDPVLHPRVFSLEGVAPEVRRDLERRMATWRLSQFLHGEQGGVLVSGQLVNCMPAHDAKLYAASQIGDEARHVEAFARYLKRLGRPYPVDPSLKSVMDEILMTDAWEFKLLGMQMIVEGLAIAAFNVMRRETSDPVLANLLEYVLRDESRHINFGMLSLRQSIPAASPAVRESLEDFAFSVCDRLYEREGGGGFRSMRVVWDGMGERAGQAEGKSLAGSPGVRVFNELLFNQVLIPRLRRLGLLTPRVTPRYCAIGLLPATDDPPA